MSEDTREALVEKMRKASVAVYLACEESVAADIAGMLREAADQLAAPVAGAAVQKARLDQIAAAVNAQASAPAPRPDTREMVIELQRIIDHLRQKANTPDDRDAGSVWAWRLDEWADELGKLREAADRLAAPVVTQDVLDGVTVAGARAFSALQDLERRHESLRAAVMTTISDPNLTWEQARTTLGRALAAEVPHAD